MSEFGKMMRTTSTVARTSGGATSTFYPDGPVPVPAVKLDANLLKVAIQLDKDLLYYFPHAKPADSNAKFVQLDQKQSLGCFIKELCEQWNLEGDENYGLLFGTDHSRANCYITDTVRSHKNLVESVWIQIVLCFQNRTELKHGNILILTGSPSLCVQVLLEGLKCQDGEGRRLDSLAKITIRVTDFCFAAKFVDENGLHLLIEMIQAGLSGITALHLHCFSELMEHGLYQWDNLQEAFVIRLSSFVTGRVKHEDTKTLTAALNILEQLVLNSWKLYPVVEREVPFETLIRHLENSSPSVQNNTLALMNTLFQKAEDTTRRASIADLIRGLPVRNALNKENSQKKSILKSNERPVMTELSHQLGVMQQLLFNFYGSRAMTPLSQTSDPEKEKLQELRAAAFLDMTHDAALSPSSVRKSQQHNRTRDFTRLGFPEPQNPAQLFNVIPPGILVLDSMLYYATKYQEECTRMILENSCRTDGLECPFAHISFELVKILTDVLRIWEPPLDQGQAYSPMFFKDQRPLEEFFVHSLRLFRKTWKEMHARKEDTSKVVTVVREQISRTMAAQPKTFQDFAEEANRISFAEIQRIWQHDRFLREQSEFQAKPIKELREELKKEIVQLVQENRLNVLKEGGVFPKYTKGQRDKKVKYGTWKLSPNGKFLLYEENSVQKPPKDLDDKAERISVVDVKGVSWGKDCIGMKETKSRKEKTQSLAFSILLEDPDATSIFLAPDEETDLVSTQAELEVETLLNLEMKIQLLDLDGVHIPTESPPIPAPPPDFDFAY